MNDVKIQWPDIVPEPKVMYGNTEVSELLSKIAEECHEGLILASDLIPYEDFANGNFTKEQATDSINYLIGKLYIILDLLQD